MATISFNDAAPQFDGPVNFVFGNEDLSLARDATVESDDATVIQGASEHPWLKVEVPVVDVQASFGYDPTDPHDNPAADHLSPLASPEAKQAAADAEQAIMDAAYPTDTPDVSAQDATPEPTPEPVAPASVEPTPEPSTPGASA